MYERSASVLERYFNGIFGFDKKTNLKTIYKDYKELIEEIQTYQSILKEEDKVITEFDEVANDIRKIQKEQKNIYKSNINYEEERNQLFDSLDETPEIIEKKLKKIEENVDKNNKRLEELREEYVKALTEFADKQRERNKYSRNRRAEEKNHLQIIEKCSNDMKEINIKILKNIKAFSNTEEDSKQEIIEIMIDNGKDERVPFDKNVIENAVNIRNEIAKKEAECYATIYDKMKRLLVEINGDEIKLDKYKKALRDISVKLAFLKAEKMYIVSFLDNERMTAMNGKKAHKQLMMETCKKLELDMEQFKNLYELILKEISGKTTKKAYKELYNKEYLKNIKEKEKNFEEEINSMKIKAGTIINSNSWRIEEIKNIYNVFQNEISEKFEKDLSEFQLEETEQNEEIEDDIFKTKIPEEDIEYIEEYDTDEYDDYEEYEEYEDNDYTDDEDEGYDEEETEEHDEDEYEDKYDDDDEDEYEDKYDDDEDEYEDEYDDDEDEYEDEYDDDDDEYEDEDDEYDIDKEEKKEYKIDKKEIKNNTEYAKRMTERQNKKGKGLFKFF